MGRRGRLEYWGLRLEEGMTRRVQKLKCNGQGKGTPGQGRVGRGTAAAAGAADITTAPLVLAAWQCALANLAPPQLAPPADGHERLGVASLPPVARVLARAAPASATNARLAMPKAAWRARSRARRTVKDSAW